MAAADAGPRPPYKPGDSVTVSVFADIKSVDVVGTSKGKGFAGPMKRYGFKGFPASHGTERKHRAPGSICGHAHERRYGRWPQEGQADGRPHGATTGHQPRTTCWSPSTRRSNLLVVKGTVPGPAGGYCIVKKAKSLGSIEWNADMIELTVYNTSGQQVDTHPGR